MSSESLTPVGGEMVTTGMTTEVTGSEMVISGMNRGNIDQGGDDDDEERTVREFNWNNRETSSVNHYFQDFVRDYKKKTVADEQVNGSVRILVSEMVMRGGSFNKLTKKEKMNIKTKFVRYRCK